MEEYCVFKGFVVDPITSKIALLLSGLTPKKKTTVAPFAPGPFGRHAETGSSNSKDLFVFPSPACRADFTRLRPGNALRVQIVPAKTRAPPYSAHLHGLKRDECPTLLSLSAVPPHAPLPQPPAERTGP